MLLVVTKKKGFANFPNVHSAQKIVCFPRKEKKKVADAVVAR